MIKLDKGHSYKHRRVYRVWLAKTKDLITIHPSPKKTHNDK